MRQALRRLAPAFVRRAWAERAFWREHDLTGEPELKALGALVRPGSLAVDVGGNVGTYSYHLSRYAKAVLTFEPNPQFADRLEGLKLPRVRVERAALSDRGGEARLRIPDVGGREDQGMASLERGAVPDARLSREITVPLRRLDDYGLSDVGFIKIDVEGHEEGVLRGATATLARERPPLLVEIEERHNPGGLGRIAEMLGALGYRGGFLRDGERRPLEQFDPARDQALPPADSDRPHARDPGRAAYVNNFLFLPEPAQGAA